MMFSSNKEAMEYAGNSYITSNTVTYMDYSKHSMDLLHTACKYQRQIGEPNIQYDGQFYYMKFNNLLNLWEQGKRMTLSKEEMINKYPYQYWNIMFQESLKDSDNWVFKENLTKEQIEARQNGFDIISKIFMKMEQLNGAEYINVETGKKVLV